MSFSTTQLRKLQQAPHSDCIRTREVNGRQMRYIEGWHAIAEANRIFGFDAWSRETIESRCVLSRESKGTFHIVYIARVRITVRTPDCTIVREGYGTGEAQAPSAGEAHDKAIKTAETDATKRAFATFGKPFGLSLYLGSRLKSDKPAIERRRTLQRVGSDGRYHVVPRKPPLLDPALASIETIKPNPIPRDRPVETTDTNVEATTMMPSISALEEPPLSETGEAKLSEAESPRPLPPELMLIARDKRLRDAAHLRFVANQPCLICSRTPSDAHHLKFAQPKAMAKKVSDEFTVPLCRIHHRQLHHGGNEVNWWIDMDIDPLPIAKELWDKSKAGQKP